MTSLSQIPGTFERSVLNSPRTFEGASGFGSQMSMWLGPPCRKMKMTLLAWPQPLLILADSGVVEALAWRRRMSARLMPRKPAPPMRRNSRRLKPSQVLPGSPGMEIIDFFLSVVREIRSRIKIMIMNQAARTHRLVHPLNPDLNLNHTLSYRLN